MSRASTIRSAVTFLVFSIAVSQPAHALVGSLWTFGFSLLSETIGVGTAVIGGGAVAATGAVVAVAADSPTGATVGKIAAVGGAAVAVIDPPPADVFFSGSWTLVYPTDLLVPGAYGWLGDWGGIAGEPAPPVSQVWSPPGSQFVIQPPNPGLTTTTNNDVLLGELTTTFDWGQAGHAFTANDPFNLFAAEFIALKPAQIEYLGSSGAGTPLPGANFYVKSSGITCVLSGDILPSCGEPETQYFRVSETPEPATWASMLLGLFALAAQRFRKRESKNALAFATAVPA